MDTSNVIWITTKIVTVNYGRSKILNNKNFNTIRLQIKL